MRKLIPALLLLLSSVSASAGQVDGVVFFDANGDGIRQTDEAGVPDVLVSDELSFVRSGNDGRFSLASPDGWRAVFIVNPTGTWPTNGFHRSLRLGPQPVEVAFGLRAQDQRLPFYFVQGTDLHVRVGVEDMMAQYVQAVNGLPLPVAFVVHTGDLIVDGNAETPEGARKLFGLYADMVRDIKWPLLNLPGNHEHVAVTNPTVSPDTEGYGKAMYRELLGPMNYAFTYAGHHCIAIDGTVIQDRRVVYSVTDEALDWLKQYLEFVPKDAPLLIFTHEPLSQQPNRDKVAALFEGRKVKLILSGHGHAIARWPFAGGTEIMGGITAYAWHGSGFFPNPLAYHILRVTEDSFDNVFCDWAERYSVTVAEPARSALLDGTVRVAGHFFDPQGQVKRIDLDLDGVRATVDQFEDGPLARSFSAALDVSQLADGFHDLRFTLWGADEPEIETQVFLVKTGKTEPFTAPNAGALVMLVEQADAPATVTLNGEQIGTIAPTGTQRMRLEWEVPQRLLRRLNEIVIASGKTPDGKWDELSVRQVRLRCGDGPWLQDYRLPRADHIRIQPKAEEPGRVTFYIDLTRKE